MWSKNFFTFFRNFSFFSLSSQIYLETTDNPSLLTDELSKLKSARTTSYSKASIRFNFRGPPLADLLISGIPDSVASELSRTEVSSVIFDKLTLSHLKNNILTVKKLENRRSPSNHNDTKRASNRPLNYSYLLRMKLVELRNHFLSIKKDFKHLRVADLFPEYANTSGTSQIYISEYLLSNLDKLWLKTKEKAKLCKFKYKWVRNGIFDVKTNDDTDRTTINSEFDLNELD